MESTTDDGELEYTSEEKVHMGDSPSKNLSDSNSLHQERSQLHDKQSPNALKPLKSSTPLPEPLIQESVDSIKSTPDDLLSRSFTEKDLNIAANPSEEMVKVSTENTIISSSKSYNKSSPVSPEVTVSGLPVETGSTEVKVSALPSESGSTEETVSALPGESGSTEETVPALPGEPGSTEEAVSDLTGEPGSAEAMSDLTGEPGSTEETVSDLTGEPGSTEETVSDLTGEPGSTEETVSDLAGEPGSTAEAVSALPGESGSTGVAVSDLTGESGSPEETVSTFPGVSGSTDETVAALSGESGSTKETVSTISKETASTEVDHQVLSEETESTEIFQLAVSAEARLNEAIQSPFDLLMSSRNKEALTSSDTKLTQIAPNDIKPSTLAENCTERVSGAAIHFSSSEDPSDSSRIAAKDMDISTFLQDCEKHVKEFDLDRLGCGSRVLDSCSPSIKPLFPNVQKPPIPLPTKNSSKELLQIFSPANDSTVSKAISSETSLSTLLSTLAKWVCRGLKNTSSYAEKVNLPDLKNYTEKEIIYGLYVLIKLNKRVDTVLEAAESLPDQESVFLCGSGGQRSLIRDSLKIAGIKVRRRLEALEVEVTEYYDKFLSVCHDNSELNCDESDVRETKDTAFRLITNLFVNASENVLILGSEIENFRSKIREFCSEIDKLL